MQSRPVAEICGAIDDALARSAFTRVTEGFVLRRYEGTLDGHRVRAALSLFLDTGSAHRLTSGQATGYELSLECDNGLSTRYLIGKGIPLMLGLGLDKLPPTTIAGSTVLVDDTPWFSTHLLSDRLRPALTSVASESTFIEQKPGLFQIKFTRIANTELPPLDAMLEAFAVLVRGTLGPPAPRPAKARLSDNRGLMMGLVTAGVLGVFALCVGAYYWAVQ